MNRPGTRKTGMNFGTHREFRAAVKACLEAENYSEAARILMENPDATTQWWLNWAFEVASGKADQAAFTARHFEQQPLLKDGDLFGESITTGRRRARR